MAIVLPAPGGPVTVVSGPRTPSVISLATRGRGTTQPGRVGTVILDVRIGSSVPFERAALCALVTIPIRVVLFPLATIGGQPCARGAEGMQGLDGPTAPPLFLSRRRVRRHHPSPNLTRVTN